MRAMIAVLGLLAPPIAAVAQSWSADQQEIIDFIARCNDAWSESLQRNDFERFAAACPESPDAVFWYTGGATPIRYSGDEGLWSVTAASGARSTWRDLAPTTVQIDGNLALIYYAVMWTVERPTGEVIDNPSRRMSVLRRENGEWRLLGGTVAAILPAPAAAPVR
jgi:ketosteroid isomerase-like protein